MDNLKELLFKSTLNYRSLADEKLSQYQGQIDYYLQKSAHFQRFRALYTLIEQAGLEEEYQEWKQQQEQ